MQPRYRAVRHEQFVIWNTITSVHKAANPPNLLSVAAKELELAAQTGQADGYFNKPFNPASLSQVMQQALGS
jgi:hypothetical protein